MGGVRPAMTSIGETLLTTGDQTLEKNRVSVKISM